MILDTITTFHNLPALVLPSSILVVILSTLLRRDNAQNQLAKAHNCQPVTKYWQWEPFWGLDMLLTQIRGTANRHVLRVA